jgi:beta-ureidopropionase / N-carbamoyl-L-amino-acid hydrolase
MMGSGVFAGASSRSSTRARSATSKGMSVGEALRAHRLRRRRAARAPLGAYFEAHIEQGPVLENEGKTIGVVQGALGQRWYDVTVHGQDAHAGPTPMALRKDALLAASRMVLEAVNRIALAHPPTTARGTVGFMQVKPNSRNVVPGEVRTDGGLAQRRKVPTLDAMCADLARAVKAIEQDRAVVSIELRENTFFRALRVRCRASYAGVREATGSARLQPPGHRQRRRATTPCTSRASRPPP